MKAQVAVSEMKNILRHIKDAFEEVSSKNPGKQYNMTLGLALGEPLIGKSDSEIKSYLEKVASAVSRFADSDVMALELNIVENGGIDAQIVQETKTRYETSKALSGKSNEVAEAKAELVAAS